MVKNDKSNSNTSLVDGSTVLAVREHLANIYFACKNNMQELLEEIKDFEQQVPETEELARLAIQRQRYRYSHLEQFTKATKALLEYSFVIFTEVGGELC